MFKPFALLVGLRYLRAKRRNHFISFISLVSVLGIALGVMVLITVLSVMNGFDDVIKSRFFSLAPQILVTNFSQQVENWKDIASLIKKQAHVKAVAPYVSLQGLLNAEGTVRPALIMGIDPQAQKTVSDLSSKMRQGHLEALKAQAFSIVLGQTLADELGVGLGDKILIITPQASVSLVGITPRYKRFTVVGMFEAGVGFGFDESYAYVNLKDAQTLGMLNNAISGLRLKLDDMYLATEVSRHLNQVLPERFYTTNWTQQMGQLFQAIKMEKTMMFAILLLIIAVAAFNLVSGLVMMVTDKAADIAIMRTFGATPRQVMSIFIIQGGLTGLMGTAFGIISGILLSLYITDLTNYIQQAFGVELLSSNIYYVNYLPSKLILSDLFKVSGISVILSLLATLYPAWRASKVQPVEALRYE